MRSWWVSLKSDEIQTSVRFFLLRVHDALNYVILLCSELNKYFNRKHNVVLTLEDMHISSIKMHNMSIMGHVKEMCLFVFLLVIFGLGNKSFILSESVVYGRDIVSGLYGIVTHWK